MCCASYDISTYMESVLRHIAFSTIDSSMALGFYCSSLGMLFY